MIATHNIKVNGKWYTAGSEIPEGKPVKAEKAVAEEPKEQPAEEPAKPKTAGRRRAAK